MANFWAALDLVTVLGAAILATLYKQGLGPLSAVRAFFAGTLIYGRSAEILLGLLGWFALSLVLVSRRLQLYTPVRISGVLHEQKLSLQACLTSALLLTATLYLVRASDIPRTIVVITVALVTVALSLRRFIYRLLIYSRFNRGVGNRNVLIVGTGPEAHALRHHLESIRHLGYTFKGFIAIPNAAAPPTATSADIVGSLDTLFQNARKHFVDEIFLTSPCERGMVRDVLAQARSRGVDVRVVPDMYDGLTWNSPIEYIGQFPTIPLPHGHVPELGMFFKRIIDVLFAFTVLLILSPILVAIAIAIKLGSRGPIFYTSDRIGKKALVFRCIKFRTMVHDADVRRAGMMHLNERDGVLFKIANDPRITRIGGFLRKYSLDELPQFINVLRGDMSVVGPRPPIASEVREYQLDHLRRLDVVPGITGLWQVQARQDPSFDNYVSLDVAYIDNWSIWLDIKIILRTIGVVFAGTGS